MSWLNPPSLAWASPSLLDLNEENYSWVVTYRHVHATLIFFPIPERLRESHFLWGFISKASNYILICNGWFLALHFEWTKFVPIDYIQSEPDLSLQYWLCDTFSEEIKSTMWLLTTESSEHAQTGGCNNQIELWDFTLLSLSHPSVTIMHFHLTCTWS